MENTNAVVVAGSTTPAMLLNLAIEKGADLDRLEKLMDLQQRWEAQEARKAYTAAMSQFKMNPPEIEKDRHVKYTTKAGNKVDYRHASLGNVTGIINSALGQCGLSAAWHLEQLEKGIKVTCTITHVQGHSESTSLVAFPDDSGGKNAIQALASTVSYLERYTVLALTGLATNDMDDDGKASDVEYITAEQAATIKEGLEAKSVDQVKFLAYMEAESIEKILSAHFNKAMASVKAAKGAKK